MAQVADISSILKRKFANNWQKMVNPDAKFYKSLAYSERQKTGDDYVIPVFLTRSNGQTFFSNANSRLQQNLQVANATVSALATVKGAEFRHREQIIETTVLASLANDQAFVNAWKAIYESAMNGILYSMEEQFITGQWGRGVTLSSVNASATTTNVTIDASYWSPAYWAGMEGLTVAFYTSNTTLVSSAANAVFTVSAVNTDTRVILFTGTATGITALDIAIAANPSAVNIHRAGLDSSGNLIQAFGNECLGIHQMLSTTGSVFNISNSTYSRWKPVNYAVGSVPLNFGKVTGAVSKLGNKWGSSAPMTVYVSPTTWNNINIDEAASRVYDSSYSKSKLEVGNEGIVYHGSTGEITIEAHPLVFDGFAYGMFDLKNSDTWCKVGDSDITNTVPGMGQIVTKVAGTNYFEMQLLANLSPFCSRLGDQIFFSGITNT